MTTDVSSMTDVLRNVEHMRESIVSVLKVVRIVRNHLSDEKWGTTAEALRVGDFMRDLRLVGASLRRLADTIDQETDKFLVS